MLLLKISLYYLSIPSYDRYKPSRRRSYYMLPFKRSFSYFESSYWLSRKLGPVNVLVLPTTVNKVMVKWTPIHDAPQAP